MTRTRVLFDSSALVAALIEDHEAHQRAFPWLDKALAGDIEGLLSTHSLAETYAVLTTLPHRPRISPLQARDSLDQLSASLVLVSLEVQDYWESLNRLAQLGLPGGGIYDALHAQAALKAKAEVLLTLNPRHFSRLGEDVAVLVRVP